MRSHWDRYETPQTIEQALAFLAEYGESAAIIAGGTDLIVNLDKNDGFYQALIDITQIPHLKEVSAEGNKITIGARATLSDVAQNMTIQSNYPLLVEAIKTIGSVQIRNVATLIGNIANASPAADGVLALLVLDSEVELVSHEGKRHIPLRDFFTGPGRTVCEPNELILGVRFEKPSPFTIGAFEKLGLRQAMAIAVVNAAALVVFEGDQVSKVRIALGSVAPTPVMAIEAEQSLLGSSLQENDIQLASELVSKACSPIDDVRSGEEYRKKMVKILTSRVLNRIKSQANDQRKDIRRQGN